jgi:hypothetical protein
MKASIRDDVRRNAGVAAVAYARFAVMYLTQNVEARVVMMAPMVRHVMTASCPIFNADEKVKR